MPQITKTQNHDDPEYVRARALCDFTASEIPELLGVGYKSAKRMVEIKRGSEPEEVPSVYQKEIMERGRQLESVAANVLEHEWLHDAFSFEETGFWRCPEDDTIGATPDRLIRKEDGSCVCVEIKVPVNIEDKVTYCKRWLAWRVQNEVQMRCVDGCMEGLIFAFDPENHDNSKCWPTQRNDALWQLILQKTSEYRYYLRNREVPVPRAKRGCLTAELDGWVAAEKEKEREVKRKKNGETEKGREESGDAAEEEETDE